MLPNRLKDFAVEVNVPVRELVKLFNACGHNVHNRPSYKLSAIQISDVLPLVKDYLQKPMNISKKNKKALAKRKKGSTKNKISNKLSSEILTSIDGFHMKVPKKTLKSKKKVTLKPPRIISTPMK